MDEQLVGTVTHGHFKAEVFSASMPGEFKVVYQDPAGKTLEEAPLTGISSYKQREQEIHERLRIFAEGGSPDGALNQASAGEY